MSNPVWKTRYGTVEVAAFEKETEKFGKQLSFSINKSYKVKDEWKRQTIYLNNAADMINVIQVMQAALDFRFSKNEVTKSGLDDLKESGDEGGI